MLKDKKLINEVIEEQKEFVSKTFSKFYRLLKSLHRQLIKADHSNIQNTYGDGKGRQLIKADSNKGFIDLIIALCRDSFNLLGRGKKELSVIEVNKLCELLGKKLSSDEFYFLIKKCISVQTGNSEMVTPQRSKMEMDDSLEGGTDPMLFKGGE